MSTFATPGQDLEQIMLVIESESQIWVVKEHMYLPRVRAAVDRVKHQNKSRVFAIKAVSMDQIAQRRIESTEEVVDTGRTPSDMERAASELFAQAVKARASDIHVRVSLKASRTYIFFRIYKELEMVTQQTSSWGKALCATIYHSLADSAASDATYDDKSRQDARISSKAILPEMLDGIRIATTPTVDGSVMVMRLLYDYSGVSDDLAELGFTSQQYAQMQVLKKRPTGMIVISGPTGSGKSTTLQRALKSMIRETGGKKHVITVEDPPEYSITGAVQTPVANAATEEDRSAAFQLSIKASMRLDPDVIMIGEMRDSPSAKLALQGAMTGHPVWSTLHANGAFHVISRLIDLGLDMNMLADPAITAGMISQRLLRKLCPCCKRPLLSVLDEYSEKDPSFNESLSRFSSIMGLDQVFVIGSDPHCPNPACYKGVIGMTVAAEIVVTDHKLMELIRNNKMLDAATYWKESLGGMSMVQHAMQQVSHGLVDPFDAESAVGHLDEGASLSRRPATAVLEAVHVPDANV